MSAYRENLAGEGSKLFWNLLTLLSWVHEIFGTFCKVKHCIENVASMDEAARRQISSELGIQPAKLDPADCMDYTVRPDLPGAQKNSLPWREFSYGLKRSTIVLIWRDQLLLWKAGSGLTGHGPLRGKARSVQRF